MRVFVKGIGALILLSGIAFGATELVGLAVHQVGARLFHGVNPTVAAATVTATATVLVAVVTLVVGRIFERRKAVEAEIRASKLPIYSQLVAGMLSMIQDAVAGQQGNAETFFKEITPKLISWASDEVLVTWSRFRRKVLSDPNEAENVFEFEKVLLAIRKDFGHKGRNVNEGDLLGLFITDIDQALAVRNAKTKAVTSPVDPKGLATSED